MAATYTPHTWTTHETIATERMNAIEQGIKTAQDTANKAEEATELRAAFDMLADQVRAELRDLKKRVTIIENG